MPQEIFVHEMSLEQFLQEKHEDLDKEGDKLELQLMDRKTMTPIGESTCLGDVAVEEFFPEIPDHLRDSPNFWLGLKVAYWLVAKTEFHQLISQAALSVPEHCGGAIRVLNHVAEHIMAEATRRREKLLADLKFMGVQAED